MQHNLLYHYVDPATKAASYEANPAAAYNLLRVGKILDVAETTLGKGGREGREVLEHVMLIGQARVGDLYEIFGDRIRRQKSTKDGSDQRESLTRVKSLDHLTSVVAALAEADFLEVVTDHSFQSPKDIYRDVEKRIIATSFPGGARGSKQKMELQSKIYEAFEEIRERSRALKRKLADPRDKVHKKQKILMNGDISHGLEHPALTSPLDVGTPGVL
jgi:DNA-directed RNA polymerase III subunit RPC3